MKTDERLYLFEMYCQKDANYVLNQLSTHARAIAFGTPSKAYDLQVNPFVLSVFEHEGTKKAVMKRLQQNDRFLPEMARLFYFATLDEVKTDIGSARKDLNGNPFVLK